ncbi:MAG TPA: DNA-binding response regulator [Balneolaceae bacterium]|nr:DNA-binding response regulator [Balneolaceae bacterium]|tara:strand:- start:234498 stop:235169 length:672 start_codon:yes stop_codon:yes gene_type:complete
MNILVVEDDPSVRTLVKAVLEHNGNSVNTEDTAASGEASAVEGDFDMIILDLGLPDGDGYEVCKNIRDKNVATPVLILSGEQETDVKVKCLKVGADDYLTKPFNTEELIARMEAIQRRTESTGDQVLACGELKVDLLKREFSINNEKVQLTNNEFNLLVYFLKNKNKIITQEELAEKVWDIHFDTQTNYINVYISYLRKKIREYSDVDYIETIRKKGFTFRCE